jgi:hypothetical protein
MGSSPSHPGHPPIDDAAGSHLRVDRKMSWVGNIASLVQLPAAPGKWLSTSHQAMGDGRNLVPESRSGKLRDPDSQPRFHSVNWPGRDIGPASRFSITTDPPVNGTFV